MVVSIAALRAESAALAFLFQNHKISILCYYATRMFQKVWRHQHRYL